MTKSFASSIAVALSLFSFATLAAPSLENTAALTAQFRKGTETLAADSMEGRGITTEGIHRAADWIESEVKRDGLQPAFGKSYRQPFDIKTGVSLGEGNRLDGVAESDWTPLAFSSSGAFDGELAFAGYGIEAPPIGYQELSTVDLKGKVALMLRYEPQERDDASPFDGKRPSRWSAMRYKVLQARERGAVAVIFVTGPMQDEEKDKLPALKNDGPESAAGIPVLQVKTSVAQKWLTPLGIDLAKFQKDVDRDLRPRTIDHSGITIHGKVAVKALFTKAENIAAILPGSGSLASEYVVIGAHYDHLGYGGDSSMKPNLHAIHNGADDNASGTVAAMLAVEQLKSQLAGIPNRRSIILALFSGEEVGLAGSSWFVAHPPVPVSKMVAMINLDMVGRLRNRELIAFGSESAPEWTSAVQKLATEYNLKITTRGDGYGPSDQTSFYGERVPVLHFFTGTTEEYHTPEDKAATLNFEGGAVVSQVVAAVAREVVTGELNPHYARAQAAPAMEGDSRGYGAYLGTVPDYKAMEDTTGGVLLADVRPRGPADRAGIRGGDRIVEMAGTRIENLYDMTYALQDHKPGQTIDVVVLRGGQRVTLRATLGERGKTEAPKPVEEKKPAEEKKEPPAAVPPDPHASMPKAAEGGISDFYRDRPGKNFVIKAGQPFTKTFEGEKHLTDIRQLTFGGENAEAYFSPDGTKLMLQSTPRGAKCDQEYILDLATGEMKRISSGMGRTTCGYFDYPEADRVIYATTEGGGDDCPPPADMSQGYVWAVYPSYAIVQSKLDGSEKKPFIDAPGYDAEATWCHHGGKLVFTSDRDGDLDLYEADETGGNIKRLTDEPGYDGGAFFSPDCREIVWRASRPKGKDLEEYHALLAKNLVHPSTMELFIMNADGTNKRQLTSNGAANFCPYFHPDGNHIIFSSNVGSASRREFDVWMLDKRGGEPERITTAEGFDGFPMFSPDGEFLVWGSNRADVASHETNIFIARWKP